MINFCLKCITASLLIILFAGNAWSAMQLIYPAERSRVSRSDYLILKTNDNAITGVRLTVNGTDSDIIQISSTGYRKLFKDMLIVQPVWDKGKNTLLIEGFTAGKVVQTVSTEIFFNPSLDDSAVPKEFTDPPFHTSEKEKICAPCHDMASSGSATAVPGTVKSPCSVCHTKLVKVKVLHEPASSFSCRHCHAKNENPRYGTGDRGSAICSECHADKTEEIKKNSFPHGPVAAGYCLVCHDPHGSDYPGSLKAPINEICLSCHEKIGKAPHVSRDSVGNGHPVSGKDDKSPKRKGKELSCASCHDPHGGVVRYFLVSRKDERMALCQFCHAK